MNDNTITHGVCRDGDRITCTVFCYVCLEVFARGLNPGEASIKTAEVREQGHTCGGAA